MPSGADLEYARLLEAAGQTSGVGMDGARLEQLSDSRSMGTKIAEELQDATSEASVVLSATYVPRWKPNTAYAQYANVVNPDGEVVSAKLGFTAGATYSASNWDAVRNTAATTTGQGRPQGAYIGNMVGNPGVLLSDGTNSWAVDTSGAKLRFMKAGVAQVASLDFDGKLILSGASSGVAAKTFANGNASLGVKRQPFANNVVIDGSTLDATNLGDKVGMVNAVTIQGGFTNEAGYGASNPSWAWAANDFFITGTDAGAVAGLQDLWSRLTEVHLRTPGANIATLHGIVGEAKVSSTGVGATVTGWMASIKANGPHNDAGASVANAAALYVTSPDPAVATNTYSIYQGGTTKNHFGGKSTFNAGLEVGGGASAFRVLNTVNAPNVQAAAAGVYAGFNSSAPAIELADGTTNVRIDNTSGDMRVLKAGVSLLATITAGGDIKAARGFALFGGAAVTAKPTVTGSRGGNAAVASLLTALASYGLITDSSSA